MSSNHPVLPQHLNILGTTQIAKAQQPAGPQNPHSWQQEPLAQSQPENLYFIEIPTSYAPVQQQPLQPQQTPFTFPTQHQLQQLIPSTSTAIYCHPNTAAALSDIFSANRGPNSQQGLPVQAQIQLTTFQNAIPNQDILNYLLQQGYTLVPQQQHLLPPQFQMPSLPAVQSRTVQQSAARAPQQSTLPPFPPSSVIANQLQQRPQQVVPQLTQPPLSLDGLRKQQLLLEDLIRRSQQQAFPTVSSKLSDQPPSHVASSHQHVVPPPQRNGVTVAPLTTLQPVGVSSKSSDHPIPVVTQQTEGAFAQAPLSLVKGRREVFSPISVIEKVFPHSAFPPPARAATKMQQLQLKLAQQHLNTDPVVPTPAPTPGRPNQSQAATEQVALQQPQQTVGQPLVSVIVPRTQSTALLAQLDNPPQPPIAKMRLNLVQPRVLQPLTETKNPSLLSVQARPSSLTNTRIAPIPPRQQRQPSQHAVANRSQTIPADLALPKPQMAFACTSQSLANHTSQADSFINVDPDETQRHRIENAMRIEERNAYQRAYYQRKKNETRKVPGSSYYERKKLERGEGPVKKRVKLTPEERKTREAATCKAWRTRNYIKFIKEVVPDGAIRRKGEGGMVRSMGHLNIKAEPVDAEQEPTIQQVRLDARRPIKNLREQPSSIADRPEMMGNAGGRGLITQEQLLPPLPSRPQIIVPVKGSSSVSQQANQFVALPQQPLLLPPHHPAARLPIRPQRLPPSAKIISQLPLPLSDPLIIPQCSVRRKRPPTPYPRLLPPSESPEIKKEDETTSVASTVQDCNDSRITSNERIIQMLEAHDEAMIDEMDDVDLAKEERANEIQQESQKRSSSTRDRLNKAGLSYYERRKLAKGLGPVRVPLTEDEKRAKRTAANRAWRIKNYVKIIKEVAPSEMSKQVGASTRIRDQLNIKSEPIDDEMQSASLQIEKDNLVQKAVPRLIPKSE